jgi:predicted dehydrogenase
LRILNNGSNLERHQWAPSDRYSGYRELVPVSCVNPLPPHDRFLDSVRDLVSCIEQRRKPACSGEDGYAAVAAVTALRESAAAGGARVAVVPPFLKEETS